MSWFNFIKTLQSKTGYAQLDFDNIVEEEETNCLKRLKEWNAKVHKYTVGGQEKKLKDKLSDMTRYDYFDKDVAMGRLDVFDEFPDIPEDVACALIEFIQGIKDYEYRKTEGKKFGKYYFSFEEHNFPSGNSYMFLFVASDEEMYKIFFTNTQTEKQKFKEWLSSVV